MFRAFRFWPRNLTSRSFSRSNEVIFNVFYKSSYLLNGLTDFAQTLGDNRTFKALFKFDFEIWPRGHFRGQMRSFSTFSTDRHIFWVVQPIVLKLWDNIKLFKVFSNLPQSLTSRSFSRSNEVIFIIFYIFSYLLTGSTDFTQNLRYFTTFCAPISIYEYFHDKEGSISAISPSSPSI